MWKSLAGQLRIELVSADISRLLRQINELGITLLDIEFINDLTVRGSIFQQDYSQLFAFISRREDRIKVLKRQGVIFTAKGLLHRPLLLSCICVFLFLILFLPSRIFFVKVEGNEHIPAKLILSQAENCGIRFGASRREVRSEKMKNALLAAIPQLQWAGVNTSGCVATISVKERSEPEETVKAQGISSIVAARDGVIEQYTVSQGTALCKVGQAVKAGQTLVSGYTDCGIYIKGTRAEAEVYARTMHDLKALTPTDAALRGATVRTEKKHSLLIGKKLIKLYKDSGISDTTCVKMYSEEYVTLPGDFELPVAWITEEYVYYETDFATQTEGESYSWMRDYSGAYLTDQMIAGQILDMDISVSFGEGTCVYQGRFSCMEMIGKVQYEEKLP